KNVTHCRCHLIGNRSLPVDVDDKHAQIAHGQIDTFGNKNRLAAQLTGVLRRADHGRADALAGFEDIEAAFFRFMTNPSTQIGTQIAKSFGFARVDVFRNATGKNNAVYGRSLTYPLGDLKILPRWPVRREGGEKSLSHPGRKPRA